MKYWPLIAIALAVALGVALYAWGHSAGKHSVQCPPVVVPVATARLDSAIAASTRAQAVADSLLALPEPKPVTIRVHEKQNEFRGMRRDSLIGILDADPRAD
jgi:hypothetical protein